MKNRTFKTCLLLALSLPALLIGQGNDDKSGTTAAQFLKIGVGARPMALGGAYAAVGQDVFSLYWNPSAITDLREVSINVTQTQWFADISHSFAGAVIPVTENSSIGFHTIYLKTDPIQITTIDAPRGTNEFYEVSDLALAATYASRVVDFLSIGFTAKYIHQAIYNETASTMAIDLSSILSIPYKGMKMGMSFSNFGGKMKMDGRDLTREFDMNPGNTINTGVETSLKTEGWDLPVNFRVGIAMNLLTPEGEGFVQTNNQRLTLAIDGNHPADEAEHIDAGLEYALQELLMLRAGYRLNKDIGKFFYGVGLNIPIAGAGLAFDYGLASFDELDYVHIVSLNLKFNP